MKRGFSSEPAFRAAHSLVGEQIEGAYTILNKLVRAPRDRTLFEVANVLVEHSSITAHAARVVALSWFIWYERGQPPLKG